MAKKCRIRNTSIDGGTLQRISNIFNLSFLQFLKSTRPNRFKKREDDEGKEEEIEESHSTQPGSKGRIYSCIYFL